MKYPTKVEKYHGTLDELARDVMEMNQYKIADFFRYMGDVSMKQSVKNREEPAKGKKRRKNLKVANKLESIANGLFKSKEKMVSVAKLCQPYLEE